MNLFIRASGLALEAKRRLSGIGEMSSFTRYLKSIEFKSKDELHSLQAQEMSVFLKHAVSNVPFYKEFKGNLELSPGTVHDDIMEFPILTKKMVKDNFTDLQCKAKGGRQYRSGGSTRQSVIIVRDKNEYMYSPNEYFNNLGGVYPGKSRLLIRRAESVYFADNPHDKVYTANPLTRTYIVSPAYMDNERLELLYRVYSKHRPRLIIGITDPVYRFAQYILDSRLKAYPLESILVGGQTMLPKYRETIEKAFGKNTVYDRYGTTEFGFLAQQCNVFGGRHYVPVVHHIETVDDAGNPVPKEKPGQFIVTNLRKRAMPLIRYKIDDIAVLTDDECPCGRGFPLIKRFEGRRIESVVSPKYTFMTPLPFYDIMSEFNNVEDFLVEQRAENSVTVQLIMKMGKFSQVQQLALRKEINRYLDYPMKLEIEYIDEIKPLPNGKVMRVKGLESYMGGNGMEVNND